MGADRDCVLEQTPEDLKVWLRERGEPDYRLAQLLRWLYEVRVDSFDAMTNLPAPLREGLEGAYGFPVLDEIDRVASSDGRTERFLYALADGEQIEAVAMEDGGRPTFCVSSQAGCKLACRFCATGQLTFGRNLTTGEILAQVTALARAGGGLRNVVFMGMGEPLLNLDAVAPALEALVDEHRFALGVRHLTVSTAGITPGIRRLAGGSVQPNLALSLNSPFDQQRSEIMPVNRRYPLEGVLEACEEYASKSGRRILLEYVLLAGVNTSPDHVRVVGRIARDLRALLNLIPFNPVHGCGFESPDKDELYRFRAALERTGAKATVRFRRGREIRAGCGQLKRRHGQLKPRRGRKGAEKPRG